MLVDTSVWVDHFRRSNTTLKNLLEAGEVWTHVFVIGELACGNLTRRSEVLRALAALPTAPLVEHGEVLALVDTKRLAGQGLGWVDMHLLASATAVRVPLLTKDKSLAAAARALGLGPRVAG